MEQWFATATDFLYSSPGAGLGNGTVSFREIAAVPEPGTVLLVVAGLIALVTQRRRVHARARRFVTRAAAT
jgi:hypothetical protein